MDDGFVPHLRTKHNICLYGQSPGGPISPTVDGSLGTNKYNKIHVADYVQLWPFHLPHFA